MLWSTLKIRRFSEGFFVPLPAGIKTQKAAACFVFSLYTGVCLSSPSLVVFLSLIGEKTHRRTQEMDRSEEVSRM